MVLPTQNLDHRGQGLGRLLQQFKGKPRVQAYMSSFLGEAQLLEDTWFHLLYDRWIESAVGEQLDVIGRIILEERQGSADVEYRAFLRARVRVNLSNGKVETMIAILTLLLDDAAGTVRLDDYYPASMRIEVVPALTVDPLRVSRMLHQAKSSGVALDFVYSTSAANDTLTWGSTYGGDGVTVSQSPGSFYVGGIGGGVWASVI
jgi:hypothetical protein